MPPKATLSILPGGVRLVCVENPYAESATFGVFAASGSRHEPASLAGISHFIEHMLFKGTSRRSAKQLSAAIEGCGGTFNAWTGEEATCFYAHVPAPSVKVAVDAIGEMYTKSAFAREEFDREKLVILEEIKMYEDDPSSVAAENLSRMVFPSNALGRSVAGGESTILPLAAEDLREYSRKAYVAGATVAVATGRIDSGKVRRMVESAFAEVPSGAPLKFKRVRSTCALREKSLAVRRDIKQTQLAIGYRAFGARDPRRYAAGVFDAIMGRGMSSRLFQSVRERRGLSYDISSSFQFFAETGIWSVSAGLDGARLGETRRIIAAEIDRIRQKAPSAAELKRVKDFLIGNYRLGLERPHVRLIHYGSGMLVWDRIVAPEEIIDGIASVTAQDVLAVAQAVLDDGAMAVSIVEPK